MRLTQQTDRGKCGGDGGALIGRSVIDYQKFQHKVVLLENADESLGKEAFAIIDRHDHCDRWLIKMHYALFLLVGRLHWAHADASDAKSVSLALRRRR